MTAYEMRISDLSSDVCSSDLLYWYRGLSKCGSPGRQPFDMPPQQARCPFRTSGYVSSGSYGQGSLQIQPTIIQRPASDDAFDAVFDMQTQHANVADHELGRASCRDRVCQNASISVAAQSPKKKTPT